MGLIFPESLLLTLRYSPLVTAPKPLWRRYVKPAFVSPSIKKYSLVPPFSSSSFFLARWRSRRKGVLHNADSSSPGHYYAALPLCKYMKERGELFQRAMWIEIRYLWQDGRIGKCSMRCFRLYPKRRRGLFLWLFLWHLNSRSA